MQRYEIRILKDNGSLSLKATNDYLNSNAAIAAARRMARGKPFEVWRGDYCVYMKEPDSGFIPPASQIPGPFGAQAEPRQAS